MTSEVERRLRESLDEHARRAPHGDLLAERIIAEQARNAAPRRRRSWPAWTLPLATAGAVAAVVATVVGVSHIREAAPTPAVSRGVVVVPTPTARPTEHPTVHSTPQPTGRAAPTGSQSSSTSTTAVTNPIGLDHFQAIDTTFVGADLAWALGTADCLNAPGTTCAAMVRTVDGGRSWHSMKPPPANVPGTDCVDPCVQGVRFASATIGYAFGPSALFMTTDAGASWQRQAGGALALESLDGDVIRLRPVGACTAGCSVQVQTAPNGSSAWTPAPLAAIDAYRYQLAREGSRAFVLTQNQSRSAAVPQASLFVSTDNGHSWVSRADPCSGLSSGVPLGASSLAAGVDGSVSLLCTGGGVGRPVVLTSTDGGASFGPGRQVPVGVSATGGSPGAVALAAVDARTLFVTGDRGLYRSADGGVSWSLVLEHAPDTDLGAPGFAGLLVGHWVTDGGRTIWTTDDGGANWSRFSYS